MNRALYDDMFRQSLGPNPTDEPYQYQREMAEELAVNQKTIRRDRETFQQAGFPLEETAQEHARKAWRIVPDRAQPGLNFAFDEALVLYPGRRSVVPNGGRTSAVLNAFRHQRKTNQRSTLAPKLDEKQCSTPYGIVS